MVDEHQEAGRNNGHKKGSKVMGAVAASVGRPDGKGTNSQTAQTLLFQIGMSI